MRDHFFRRHRSAISLVREFGGTDEEQTERLTDIRSQGMWAYVDVPDDDQDAPAAIHFWHRKDQDPRAVALMLGHELGHIAGGGPYGEPGSQEEEDRADEYGRAAQEALNVLVAFGMISGRAGSRLDPRGPDRAGRVRRAVVVGAKRRPSR